MNFYLDITLLPGAEIDINFLWGKAYKQVHLGLAEVKAPNGLSNIGVSFPQYNAEHRQLGAKLRLFCAEKTILETLNVKKWLSSLMDYVHLTSIREVPSHVTKYVRYKRQQPKSNTQRLARRKAKREDISYEQSLSLLKERKEVFVEAPYIHMKSLTTNQNFRIFIVKEDAPTLINEGFSCYGLSAVSTVPDF